MDRDIVKTDLSIPMNREKDPSSLPIISRSFVITKSCSCPPRRRTTSCLKLAENFMRRRSLLNSKIRRSYNFVKILNNTKRKLRHRIFKMVTCPSINAADS